MNEYISIKFVVYIYLPIHIVIINHLLFIYVALANNHQAEQRWVIYRYLPIVGQ